MNTTIDHIYICHYSRLVERKLVIQDQLNNFGIKENLYTFIENYDKDTLDKEEIKKEYPLIFNLTKRDGRYLRSSEISLALKHCYIIKDAINKNYNTILILEDDAILDNNFFNQYEEYIKELPENWDIFWLGGCCGLRSANISKDKHVYEVLSSRCCHCYAIKKSGLEILKNSISNIDEAIDWYFNDIILKLNLNSYWCEPPICEQNSLFESTVQL
jgi:GR25 family glycosyltransferase involved in LPS biosynthesis